MHFGPDSILIVIEVDVLDQLDLDEAESTIREIREEIKRLIPKATQVYIHTRP
jgi:divalent metal cation (Fe/Co/Zn/Cd) transporter